MAVTTPGRRVRSTNDGQLGFTVELESGGLGVRLDRRGEQRIVPFVASQWREDLEPELTPIQRARVFYDADRALKVAKGAYSNTIPEWISVPEDQRRAWIAPVRWAAVLEFMRAEMGALRAG